MQGLWVYEPSIPNFKNHLLSSSPSVSSETSFNSSNLFLHRHFNLIVIVNMSAEKKISSAPQDNHLSVHAKMSHEENRLKNKESENGVVDHETPEWKQSEKSLVRKLDITLMPMVWILYMFNYLDRNNIA